MLSQPLTSEFDMLTPYLATGDEPPEGWRSIAIFPMLIFIGGMGAGKSTIVQSLLNFRSPPPGGDWGKNLPPSSSAGSKADYQLPRSAANFFLLPNRRDLTDQLIVAPLQRADGDPAHKLDRLAKLSYIKRYLQLHEAGLAYALTRLWVSPEALLGAARQNNPGVEQIPLLLFDGLRGEEEIPYAARYLPLARFIALTAPPYVRLLRLLERQDDYDTTTSSAQSGLHPGQAPAAHQFITETGLFTPAEISHLDSLVRSNRLDAKDLRDKVTLLSAERSLYNLETAISALKNIVPSRVMVIDTTRHNPGEVHDKIMEFRRTIHHLALC